jgi:septum formation protein
MLIQKIKDYNIILASASPRRQELLASLGIKFVVDAILNVDENYPESMSSDEIPYFLAKKKSLAYSNDLNKSDILITADTIVSQDDEILLKPASRDDAFITLNKLAGNSHYVYTGVYLRSKNDSIGFISATEVRFGELTDEEIYYYIDTYKPYDKAGAYGIQEWIGYVAVEEIRGSYFNVMGLPIHKLYQELNHFIK